VGRAPGFFVAHRAGPGDILLLLGVLLVLAPLVPLAVIAVVGVPGSRVRSAVTATIIAILVGLVAVQVMKQVGVTRWTVAVPPAVAALAVTALLYGRFNGVSQLLHSARGSRVDRAGRLRPPARHAAPSRAHHEPISAR
jgi:hypothetical protein